MKAVCKAALVFALALPLAGFGDPAYFANKRGNESYAAGDYQKALDEYLAAQSGDPGDKAIDYNLGGAYYGLGRFEDAAKAYTRAMETSDDELKRRAAFNRGAALYRAGETTMKKREMDKAGVYLNESVRQYVSLLRDKRDDTNARHNLELALARLKELEQKQQQQKSQRQGQQKNKDAESEQDKQKKSEDQDKKQSKQDEAKKESGEDKNKPVEEKERSEQNKEKEAKPEKITPEQAERIFKAIEQDERGLKEKIRAQRVQQSPPTDKDKDW